jgi:large exoprotein involved in heme utilization and adhesion
VGQGGRISIRSESLNLANQSILSADTNGQGDAGNIQINVGSLTMNLLNSSSSSGANLISAQTNRQGNAGNISINARDSVLLDGQSRISSTVQVFRTGDVEFLGTGRGGNIDITTRRFRMANGARIFAFTAGQGDAGSVRINADSVSLDQSSIATFTGFPVGGAFDGLVGTGNAGDVQITARRVSLTNGSGILATTDALGNAGSVLIRADELLRLDAGSKDEFTAIGSSSLSNAVGQGGNIRVVAGELALSGYATLSTFTAGRGNAGNITIQADRVSLLRGAGLSASTAGQGNAGNINVRSTGQILVGGVRPTLNTQRSSIVSVVESGGVGRAGNINIRTSDLRLQNGGAINATTAGQGRAGDIRINVSDRLDIRGTAPDAGRASGVFSTVGSTGNGNGGTVAIAADRLFLRDGGIISASTFGQGRAGDILVSGDRLLVSGVNRLGFSSGMYTNSGQGATEQGGDINLNIDHIRLDEAGVISAQTFSSRVGGNITVNAEQVIAINGGQMITTTASPGRAGVIRLNATALRLSGRDATYSDRLDRQGRYNSSNGEQGVVNQGASSGIYANTNRTSTGRGGDIISSSQNLTLQDSAEISVESRGTGRGGQISLQTDALSLNDGRITSNTARSDSGGIAIQSDALILRDRSRISTNAGSSTAPGNGGDININAGTIVAVPTENSDITANAFTGNGGAVDITTQGIIGLEATPTNINSSNITASSDRGVQGVVTLNTPTIDPAQGLIELPATVTDASSQIDQTCSRANRDRSEFVVSGRGSLPPSPLEPVRGSEMVGQLATLEETASSRTIAPIVQSRSPIVEAQGWTIAANGKVMLVASASSASAGDFSRSNCHPTD